MLLLFFFAFEACCPLAELSKNPKYFFSRPIEIFSIFFLKVHRLEFWIILSKISIVSSWTKCALVNECNFLEVIEEKVEVKKEENCFVTTYSYLLL